MAIPICEIHKTIMKQTPFYEFDDEKYYCVKCFRLKQAKKLIDSQLLEKGFVAVSVEDLKILDKQNHKHDGDKDWGLIDGILKKYLAEDKQ